MVRGVLVLKPRRARPPRSRSKEILAFSSVALLTYSTVSHLLLVDGKPDQNITDTRKLAMIWKAGKVQED